MTALSGFAAQKTSNADCDDLLFWIKCSVQQTMKYMVKLDSLL